MDKEELAKRYAAAESFTDKLIVWWQHSPYSALIGVGLLVGAGFIGAWIAS